MVVLWLIEFLLFASVAILLIVICQKVIATYRTQSRAHAGVQELMRFEEAKNIVLQHAERQVRHGVPFEQAVLIVLSEKYWPEPESSSPE